MEPEDQPVSEADLPSSQKLLQLFSLHLGLNPGILLHHLPDTQFGLLCDLEADIFPEGFEGAVVEIEDVAAYGLAVDADHLEHEA